MAAQDKHTATTVVVGANKTEGLVRFSYLHVFTPRMNKDAKREEYSVQLMIPKTNKEDHAKLVAAIEEQKKILWPNGKTPPNFRSPIIDGDSHVNRKGEDAQVPGHWLLGAKVYAFNEKGEAQAAPGVVGTTRDETGKLKSLTQNQIKSGDWGRASVNLKSYTKGDGGVGCYINSLQLVREGEALSSRKSAADEFDDYTDEVDENDPLG